MPRASGISARHNCVELRPGTHRGDGRVAEIVRKEQPATAASASTRSLLRTNRSSAMTLREMAGVAAKGQWTEVDAGLPPVVQSGHAIGVRAHFRFGSPANR
jgi:hypothetical protein